MVREPELETESIRWLWTPMQNDHLTLDMRHLGLALCLVAAACVDGGPPDREPAWILMNVLEMELNGQLYDPEMSPQPSIFRSAHIRFVAPSPDSAAVDVFVRDDPADGISRFRVLEDLDAICEALRCARVGKKAP